MTIRLEKPLPANSPTPPRPQNPGGYETMQLANGKPSSRQSPIAGSDPTVSLKIQPIVTPLPSTAATMKSVCALHESKEKANNDVVQGVPHSPDKGKTGGPLTSNWTTSRFRSNNLLANKVPQNPQHPKRGRGVNDGAEREVRKPQGRRGARRTQGIKPKRSFGTPASVSSILLRLSQIPLLEQGIFEPDSERNARTAGKIKNASLNESSSLGGGERGYIAPPVVQGSRTVKEAFVLAERYAMTAVGDGRKASSRSGSGERNGSIRVASTGRGRGPRAR